MNINKITINFILQLFLISATSLVPQVNGIGSRLIQILTLYKKYAFVDDIH